MSNVLRKRQVRNRAILSAEHFLPGYQSGGFLLARPPACRWHTAIGVCRPRDISSVYGAPARLVNRRPLRSLANKGQAFPGSLFVGLREANP